MKTMQHKIIRRVFRLCNNYRCSIINMQKAIRIPRRYYGKVCDGVTAGTAVFGRNETSWVISSRCSHRKSSVFVRSISTYDDQRIHKRSHILSSSMSIINHHTHRYMSMRECKPFCSPPPQPNQIRCFGNKPYYWQTEDVADHDEKIDFEDDEDENVIAPLVVCGPPGVGTRTIIKRFLQKHSDVFASVVSHTNRLPKRNEENGIDFHFVSDREMEEMIYWEDLFEHSTINGKVYGTAYHSIFRIHGDGGPERREIMDIDMYGVKRLKEVANSVLIDSTGYKLRPKYIFVAPPDLPTLRYRLEERNLESEADREKMLQLAEQEIHYGMSKAFHARVYHVNLDQAVHDFTEAVGNLYDRMGRKLLTDDLERLRQPAEEGKLFRKDHRNKLIQSLDNDAINPVTPQDSRIIRQARRHAWIESQKQLKEHGK